MPWHSPIQFVQKARLRSEDYSLNDADGLALFVPTQGKKKWHFRFMFGNSRPRMSFGVYPDISWKMRGRR